jgi:hypothetical protein
MISGAARDGRIFSWQIGWQRGCCASRRLRPASDSSLRRCVWTVQSAGAIHSAPRPGWDISFCLVAERAVGARVGKAWSGRSRPRYGLRRRRLRAACGADSAAFRCDYFYPRTVGGGRFRPPKSNARLVVLANRCCAASTCSPASSRLGLWCRRPQPVSRLWPFGNLHPARARQPRPFPRFISGSSSRDLHHTAPGLCRISCCDLVPRLRVRKKTSSASRFSSWLIKSSILKVRTLIPF